MNKRSTPLLAAVARMHRDDDNHPGRNPAGRGLPNGSPGSDPYNTVRPHDVIEWTPTASSGADAPMGESVTMWTDENGLDRYTSVLEMDDAR